MNRRMREGERESMICLFVDCECKPESVQHAKHKLTGEILPILQGQPDFLDLLVLTNVETPGRILCITTWSDGDAERNHSEHYDIIAKPLQSELAMPAPLDSFRIADWSKPRTGIRRTA